MYNIIFEYLFSFQQRFREEININLFNILDKKINNIALQQ